jgi:hypothetical protein
MNDVVMLPLGNTFLTEYGTGYGVKDICAVEMSLKQEASERVVTWCFLHLSKQREKLEQGNLEVSITLEQRPRRPIIDVSPMMHCQRGDV